MASRQRLGLNRRVGICVALSAALVAFVTGMNTASATNSTGTFSLLKDRNTSAAALDPQVASLELGTKFKVSTDGKLAAVRFLKAPGDTTSHAVSVWDNETGARLATTTSDNETASGWQQVALPSAISLKAGKFYTVSYRTEHYMSTNDAFSRRLTSGPLTAPRNAGVFTYGNGIPQDTYRASSYWVDAVVTTGSVAVTTTTTRPAVTTTTAAAPRATTTTIKTTTPTTTKAPVTTTTAKPTPTKPVVVTTLPPASTGAWPNATNTGVPAGTVLKASGDLNITQDNTVIDGLDINGSVQINAKNVVIKNSKIHDGGDFGINTHSGSVTIMDSELYNNSEAAILYDNWTALRVNIHGMGSDGVKLGTNTLLQDSYIHDFKTDPGSHADGGQLQAGEKNITVRHNYIVPLSGENSALFMAPDLGPSSAGPVVVDNNLLGGGNYTIYIVDGNNGQYHESGYSITNNHFLRNATYGSVNINEPASSFSAWSGNVYDDNGAALNR